MTILQPGSSFTAPTAARPDTPVQWTGRELTLLLAALLPISGMFILVEPIPQPAAYFEFADNRTLFGVANFWNVTSNALFLVFGLAGLLLLARDRLTILDELRIAYVIFFSGIALTAFGSGWFHLAPDNDTLYWDRLPMTVAFMSLFAIILGEHISAELGRMLLWPLLVVGAASVMYWDYTESVSAGDLRFYGLVQFLPMLLIPAIFMLYRSRFSTINFLWATIGLYALAKVLEFFDEQIFAAGDLISGHSLKHIVASLVPLVLMRGMQARQLR